MSVISHLFKDTLTITNYSRTVIANGQVDTSSTTVTVLGKGYTKESKDYTSPKGKTRTIATKFALPTGTTLNIDDEITYNSKGYIVVEINEVPGFSSQNCDHIEARAVIKGG